MSLERFEELYERYSDGALGAEEREEFRALLSDPRYRAKLVELSAFEASISEETHLREEGGGPSVPWEEESGVPALWGKETKGSSRRLPAVRLKRPEPTRWLSGSLVAAAALFVTAGILLLLRSEDGGTSGSRSPTGRGHVIRTFPPPVARAPLPEEPVPPVKPLPPRPAPVEVPPAPVAPAKEAVTPEPQPQPLQRPAVPEPSPLRSETKPTEVTPPPPPPVVPPMAQIDRFQGQVFVLGEGGTKPAEGGQVLKSSQGLRVGSKSSASVKWWDGTRLELGADTELSRLADTASGKLVQLEQGILGVEAARQIPGHPLMIATPHSESTVLGTEFTLFTTPTYTRLDVREGRVKFTRLPGITSLVVGARHYAIAGAGFEFVVRAAYSLWKPSTSGLQLWLRADSGVRLSGNSVADWKDQSPVANDASQADPASQPTFVPGAVQGRPAIRFSGIDQFLVLPSGFGDFRAGLSAFLVVKVGATPATMRFLDLDQGPTCDNISWGRKDSSDKLAFWVYADCLSRGKVEAPGSILIDQYQTLSVVSAPAPGRVTLYRNGVPMGSGVTSVPRSIARKPNFIGKSNTPGDPCLKGDLCEVFLFNRAVQEEERSSIERYLASKYFDPTTPPVLGRTTEK